MELNRDNIALIDKIVMYNFKVIDILPFEDLQKQGIISVKEKAKSYIETRRGDKYSSLNAEKIGMIDRLTYSIGIGGEIYGCMEMSIPPDEYHNLNCLSADEYKDLIDAAMVDLAWSQGIIIEYEDLKYKKIEINKTIKLEGLFTEYQRVLQLMMYLLPAKLRLHGLITYAAKDHPQVHRASDNKREIQTFMKSSGENGLTVKVYDKSSQLEEEFHIHISQNYLRYEITLNSPKKIQETLGTNRVYDLSDDMIQKFWGDFVRYNIERTYRENCKKRSSEMLRILKDHYKYNDKKWIQQTLLEISNKEIASGIPLMLDIKELTSLLSRIPFSTKYARYNSKKRFREEAAKNIDVFIKDDDMKYEEIINKLLGC